MSFFKSRSFFLSALTGLLLWAAFPGGGELWLLVCVALLPILHVAKGENLRTSFAAGFCGGIIHHLLLLYWLLNVLSKYGGLPLYFAIPGLLLLSAYMALYFGLFAAIASFLCRRSSELSLLFVLPALWVGIDWFRGIFLTGFPWMDLGYALYNTPRLIQIADLFGHHGVTYLVVFVNCLVFLSARPGRQAEYYLRLLVPAVVILSGTVFYSNLQFAEMSAKVADKNAKKETIGIVQGNIDQSKKWSPALQQATVEKYFLLTDGLVEKRSPAFVVWPETALPFYPTSSSHTRLLTDYVVSRKVPILTGSPWYEIVDIEKRNIKYFNSAFLLQPDGIIGDKYYKNHLVPFGEYVPLKRLLFFLAPLVEAVGDFSSGAIETPVVWEEVRAGVLICFESVFPELSRKWVQMGANVLVNLTNDAWYGKSSAPYHSLAMAVFRAVETRRSVVRSANTGISAFISPNGIIESRSEVFVSWAGADQVILLDNTTFWVRYGYLFGPACLAVALLCTAIAGTRRRQMVSSAWPENENIVN